MKQPALGNSISSLRNQKGMTQKELAEACAIDIRTIQRIEAGEVTPRMHTIKLLSSALECNTAFFTVAPPPPVTTPTGDPDVPTSQLRLAFYAGIVCSVNAIPVVFDLITHSLNAYFQVCTFAVHIVSCLFFLRGFYLIGRQYNNPVLAVSSLLAMVLWPLVNVIYVLKDYYASGIMSYALFVLLCVNEIIRGIGFLTEAYKRKKQYRINYYNIAGFIIIIQSLLYLSSYLSIVAIGLIISLLSGAASTAILYMEYTHPGSRNILFTNKSVPAS